MVSFNAFIEKMVNEDCQLECLNEKADISHGPSDLGLSMESIENNAHFCIGMSFELVWRLNFSD